MPTRRSGRCAIPVDAPFRSTRRSGRHAVLMGTGRLHYMSLALFKAFIQLSTYIFLIRYELWLAQHLDQRHSLG